MSLNSFTGYIKAEDSVIFGIIRCIVIETIVGDIIGVNLENCLQIRDFVGNTF